MMGGVFMSKKNKRNICSRKGSKARTVDIRYKDRHHLCYTKHGWRKGSAKRLRLHPYCVVEVPKYTLHAMIHSRVDDIPAPSDIAAEAAIEQLEMLQRYKAISNEDGIEKRLWILYALFECVSPATADAFARQIQVVREYYDKPP